MKNWFKFDEYKSDKNSPIFVSNTFHYYKQTTYVLDDISRKQSIKSVKTIFLYIILKLGLNTVISCEDEFYSYRRASALHGATEYTSFRTIALCVSYLGPPSKSQLCKVFPF